MVLNNVSLDKERGCSRLILRNHCSGSLKNSNYRKQNLFSNFFFYFLIYSKLFMQIPLLTFSSTYSVWIRFFCPQQAARGSADLIKFLFDFKDNYVSKHVLSTQNSSTLEFFVKYGVFHAKLTFRQCQILANNNNNNKRANEHVFTVPGHRNLNSIYDLVNDFILLLFYLAS